MSQERERDRDRERETDKNRQTDRKTDTDRDIKDGDGERQRQKLGTQTLLHRFQTDANSYNLLLLIYVPVGYTENKGNKIYYRCNDEEDDQ